MCTLPTAMCVCVRARVCVCARVRGGCRRNAYPAHYMLRCTLPHATCRLHLLLKHCLGPGPVRAHVCTYACMYVCMYVCMYACTFAYMHACMRVRLHMCMYTCMLVCLYVCMRACKHACRHVCNTHACTLNHATSRPQVSERTIRWSNPRSTCSPQLHTYHRLG